MEIEEQVKISILFKYYGNLLTERQQKIVSMYVDSDLSLAEVSDELKITRQAVKDALDNSLKSLLQFEDKLHFYMRDEKIKSILKDKSDAKIDASIRAKIISILEE